MSREPIIVDDVDVSGCECIIEDYQRVNNFKNRYEHIKNVCELGERGAEYYNLFCKDNPNCYHKQLKRKEKECEDLKKKLKPKLKNAHCTYFEGQTGLCRAKEFLKCNPVGCRLYTIDELSTIVDLQQQVDQLKAENEILEKDRATLDVIIETLKVQFKQLEKENVKLKELVKTRIEDLCDSCGASSMMPMSCKVYEQVLQEIIKIAEEYQKEYIVNNGVNLLCNQILQKCEVLKDE